jgi:hypothetical protein
MYVSITGLTLKSPWMILRFYYHAIPCIKQAKTAKGNIHTSVKKINKVYHTLTGWESKEAMQDFLYNGAHKKAMRVFSKIATGKTFGFDSDTLPSWADVPILWQRQGKGY